MNKVYKVIYSKARQCYVVVSELAKSHHKSASSSRAVVGSSKLSRLLVAALGVGTLMWGSVPNFAFAGGPGFNNNLFDVVRDDQDPSGGSIRSLSAKVKHEISEDSTTFPKGEGASIAIGENAYAYMQGGSKAQYMLFGEKEATGAIAIGQGSMALSQSIAIGNRVYMGELGDVKISDYSKNNGVGGAGVGSVLLGSNSYTGGTLTTLMGDYSIISTSYPGNNGAAYTQNAGAVSIGALNSIESATSTNTTSGIANSIVGLANRTQNANGALIYGAGNEITNSIATASAPGAASSAKAAANSLRQSVKSNPGGAALAIGGGNKIDKSIRTQTMGVNNEVTGSLYHEDAKYGEFLGHKIQISPEVNEYSSQYNMVDGYNNKVSNTNNAYVIGTNNTILGKTFSADTKDGTLSKSDLTKAKESDNLVIIGDNHTMAKDVKNNIAIGTSDNALTTSVSNAVLLGHNADVQKNGGVALGSGSIATIDAAVFGWDPSTKAASTTDSLAWKSGWAAVSVGDSTHTRQITNVAAGFNDTDAVNVAQLKAAMGNAGSNISLVAGDGIKIDSKNGKYTISANITGGKTDTDTTKVDGKTSTSGDSGSTDQGKTDTTGSSKQLVVTTDTNPTKFAADEGTAAEVKPSETLAINGDKTNIATKVDGKAISVKLKDDINVKTVTATDSIGIKNGPSMTKDGINAASKKITNVAAGTETTDAVNYGQLKDVESKVDNNTQSITNINGRVNDLYSRVNKVGAGAAALAALHPLDFDPDDKWDFAVGYGNYRDANSVAVGAFYRPDEDTMFSLGTNFGNGENMINAGVSFKFGQKGKTSSNRLVINKEVTELRATVSRQDEQLKKQDDQLKKQDNEIKELKDMVNKLLAAQNNKAEAAK